MKFNLKRYRNKKIILFLVFLIFLISESINLRIGDDNSSEDKHNRKLDSKLKKQLILTPKLIDADHPTDNWAKAKADGWCTGSGTYGDPYIIENHKFKTWSNIR